MNKEEQKKKMRQSIMAAASKQGWNYEAFHQIMMEWGYGNSLRQLDLKRLIELLSLLHKQTARSDQAEYDTKGKIMYSVMKDAGWTNQQLKSFMLKRYKTLHWNRLNDSQKDGVIAMLRKYGGKRNAEKKN